MEQSVPCLILRYTWGLWNGLMPTIEMWPQIVQAGEEWVAPQNKPNSEETLISFVK